MRPSTVFRVAMAVTVLAAILPRESSGQQPAFSGVAGTVIDSIHGVVPLPNATVMVGSTGRKAVTDAEGRFRIDSIPAGDHSLTLIHPLLDTLNVAITTRAVAFPAGQTLSVELAVPSAERVI